MNNTKKHNNNTSNALVTSPIKTRTMSAAKAALLSVGMLFLTMFVVLWPLATIWALNTLFTFQINFTFWTWLSCWIILFSINGATRNSRN